MPTYRIGIKALVCFNITAVNGKPSPKEIAIAIAKHFPTKGRYIEGMRGEMGRVYIDEESNAKIIS